MHKYAALLGLGLVLASGGLHAGEWPQFRGATGDGVSTDSNLPVTWSAQRGVKWSVPVVGRANSSPAVTAERIDVTSEDDAHGLWVVSYDRKSGKLLRKTQVGTGTLDAKGPAKLYAHRHNAATPSPAADGQHIYAYFGSGQLYCVEAATGKIAWQRDLVKDYGPYDITFGMASSPRLWGDHVFVACMTKGPSYVVALDKKTGKEVWKKDRKLPAANDGPDGYSSPIIYKHGARTELLVSGSDHVNSYDPVTGNVLWASGGLEIKSEFGRVIASPAGGPGVVLATSANPGGGGLGRVLALKAGGTGDVTKTAELWRQDKSTPDSSTPVCYDGCAYLCSDQGVATCLDLASGKMHWQQRLPQGPYQAALVAGDGKVYFLSIEGTCTVMAAGKEAKVLAENSLPGTFYATPALSDGTLYLRSYDKLYAITGETSTAAK